MSYIYTLDGDPVSFSALKITRAPGWDHAKQIEFNARNNLSNQHSPLPPINKPFSLRVEFFFNCKRRRFNVVENHTNDPNDRRPSVLDLIKFVEYVGTDVLWDKARFISHVYAFKKFDEKPRTIIEIEIL